MFIEQCIYICVYIYVHVYVDVSIYLYIRIRIRIRIHIHIHRYNPIQIITQGPWLWGVVCNQYHEVCPKILFQTWPWWPELSENGALNGGKTIKPFGQKNGGIFPQAVFDGAGGIRSPTYKVAQLIRLCHRSGWCWRDVKKLVPSKTLETFHLLGWLYPRSLWF